MRCHVVAVPLVLLAACASPRPPVTQVEAIAACYTAVLDEEPALEIDRPETRAEQDGDERWTITGAGTDGALTFRCRVTPQGEVTASRVSRGTSG